VAGVGWLLIGNGKGGRTLEERYIIPRGGGWSCPAIALPGPAAHDVFGTGQSVPA